MSVDRFYFDWANYRTMLRLLRGVETGSQRRKAYAGFLIGIPIMAAIHAVCFALDPILFPSLRRTDLRGATFCVGHARSGTTYLHRLMASDPQFSYTLMYEMFFPSLLQKRLLRLLFRVDERVFGGRLRKKLDEAGEVAFEPGSDMHKSGLFVPEEDDFLLTFSLGSGFWMILFPYLDQLDFYRVDSWNERKRQRVMTFYRECVRRQVALNGGGIHLSKNPTFCGRVQALIETFPEARFVIPIRNPYETIPSILKMMQTMWTLQGRDEQAIDNSLRFMAEQSFDCYQHPLEVLAKYPDTRSVVIDYRDLVREPSTTMRHVYDELELELGPEAARAIDSARSGHESLHHYSMDEFGLDHGAVRRRLAPLFEQYGWDTTGEVTDVNAW